MSSLKLKRYDDAEAFDFAIENGSFAFADDSTDKVTMALRLVTTQKVNDLGEDIEELGGELLIDDTFFTRIEDFINTSLSDNIDAVKNEVETAMNYVGVNLQDLNVVDQQNNVFVEITPVNGETINVNF